MFRRELIERRSVDKLVQRGDHRRAFPRGVLGRAVERVAQEHLRLLGLRDRLVQRRNLLSDNLVPPWLGASRTAAAVCSDRPSRWTILMNASRRSSSDPYIRRPACRALGHTNPRSS
jgi:hypothetical protein